MAHNYATAGYSPADDSFGEALDDDVNAIVQLRRDSSPVPATLLSNLTLSSKPTLINTLTSSNNTISANSVASTCIIRHPKKRRNSDEHNRKNSSLATLHEVPQIVLPSGSQKDDRNDAAAEGMSSSRSGSAMQSRGLTKSMSPRAQSSKKFNITIVEPPLSPSDRTETLPKDGSSNSLGVSTPRGMSSNGSSGPLRKNPSSDRVAKAIAMHRDRVMRSHMQHTPQHTPLKIKQKLAAGKKSTGRKATRLNVQQSQSIRAQLSVMSLDQLREAELTKKDAVKESSGYVRNPHKIPASLLNVAESKPRSAYDDESGKIDSSVLSLSDFTVLRTLGHGTYGVVKLVRYKGNNGLFALKILEKRQQIDEEEVDHVMTESKMLKMLKYPFIVKQAGSFQDEWQLYILMEYVTGSDLFAYMQEYRFNDYTVKFFAAQIVLTLEYLHSLNVVFRDLKPENLLVDWKGYLKLTDFSFAKDIPTNRTSTFCGTPCYIAPEIILQEGHGKCVDWWALGILIFEMIEGHPPFDNENVVELYDAILTVNPLLSSDRFSEDCADLVRSLLIKDPEARLGAKGPQEVKEHPFFEDLDWNAILQRTMPSPLPTHLIEAVSAGNNPEPEKPRMGRPLTPEEQTLFEGF